ncbi:hypothetical protein BJ742DRAFT_679877 [Cladochytrium replicatum]|nr:hypothetical protein BJ742DRAFT_679877 [Cladochytrium replicatum]
MAIVRATVPQNLLNIAPSTYVSGSTVTYNADAAATCYWPSGQCLRRTAIAGVPADVFTCPGNGQWGLTYDDGPISANGVKDTPALLAALASQNIHATFFVVGANVRQYPAVVRDTDLAGHQIALHTWSHHPLTSLSNEQIVAELKYTEAIVYQSIGKVAAFFRPPYGDIDDRVRAIAGALGYTAVIWDKDSADASSTNANTVSATIAGWYAGSATTGFVSLQHDITAFTAGIAINALSAISSAKAAGTFKYTPQPVGTCVGRAFYQYDNATLTGTTTMGGGAVVTNIGGNATTNPKTVTVTATATATATAAADKSSNNAVRSRPSPPGGLVCALAVAAVVSAVGAFSI